jgi:hypothetical protein
MNEAEREGAAVPPAAEVRAGAAQRRTLPAAASGWRWLPLSVAVIVADRVVKLWITHHFAPLERGHVLKVLDIILTYNTGAAFSFLADASGWQRWCCHCSLGVSAHSRLAAPSRCPHPRAARLRTRAHRRVRSAT